jgi:ribosome-binding factor A
MRHGHPGAPSAPSNRQLRVGENLRHALADIFQRDGVDDRALAGVFITVPEVRMSPDLKLATVYIMPLGGKNVDGVVAALERHRRQLRGALAKRVDMKFIPELRFRADETFAAGEMIDRLLTSPEVTRDTRRNEGDG